VVLSAHSTVHIGGSPLVEELSFAHPGVSCLETIGLSLQDANHLQALSAPKWLRWSATPHVE
jgi:hypothetical protein